MWDGMDANATGARIRCDAAELSFDAERASVERAVPVLP